MLNIEQGDLIESNDYVEKVFGIRARFNRLSFHDGGVFHSDNPASPPPDTDPAPGRLMLNGFSVCRNNL